MNQKLLKLFAVVIVSSGLFACAATGSKLEKQLVSQGATQLNAAQVTDYLSGNTQVWTTTSSGAYFQADGKVTVKFLGRTYPLRTWTVDSNGKVCIAFPNGFVSSCSVYYDKGGEIWYVTLEIMGELQESDGGPDSVMQGNQLSEI